MGFLESKRVIRAIASHANNFASRFESRNKYFLSSRDEHTRTYENQSKSSVRNRGGSWFAHLKTGDNFL